MTEQRLIKRHVVERRTSLARSTIYSMMKQGRFPSQVHLGPHSVRWHEAEIDEFIANPRTWAINQALKRLQRPQEGEK